MKEGVVSTTHSRAPLREAEEMEKESKVVGLHGRMQDATILFRCAAVGALFKWRDRSHVRRNRILPFTAYYENCLAVPLDGHRTRFQFRGWVHKN